MKTRLLIGLCTGALGYTLALGTANAAPPVSPPASDLAVKNGSTAEKATWRHRRWHRHRHYRRYGRPGFRFYFGPRRYWW